MKWSDLSSFNAFDWTVVIIVGLSMFAGFRRGIVRTLLGIVGFVGGFLLACWDYNRLGDWLRQQRWVSSVTASAIVAFLMLLALVGIGAALVGRMLRKSVRAVGLGYWDRTLGMIFGLVRGCVFAIALVMIPGTFAPQSKLIISSELSPYLFAAAHDVSFLLPH
jgi:membrane protein required for colicin V production